MGMANYGTCFWQTLLPYHPTFQTFQSQALIIVGTFEGSIAKSSYCLAAPRLILHSTNLTFEMSVYGSYCNQNPCLMKCLTSRRWEGVDARAQNL